MASRTARTITRRSLLRATGVALALPMLEAMMPRASQAASVDNKPRRMLAICNNLGVLPELFFPEANDTGRSTRCRLT